VPVKQESIAAAGGGGGHSCLQQSWLFADRRRICNFGNGSLLEWANNSHKL